MTDDSLRSPPGVSRPDGAEVERGGGQEFAASTVARLLEHMPIALWGVDARSSDVAFAALRAQGVGDIAAYLAENPDVVETACDEVFVTRVNHAAMRLFAATDEAQCLRPVRYVFEIARDVAARVMVAHFEGRRTHVDEMRIQRFDGSVTDILFLVTFPRPPEPLDMTFLTMVEISDRVEAEAQLRQLQADFAHAARIATLGEMTTSIAHELKQPLSAIVMNAQTGLRWLGRPLPNLSKVQLLFERMIECATQATEIIARVQGMASKQAPAWSPVSLNRVVDVALQFVRHDSLARRVDVRCTLARNLPPVSGDMIQLQQVVVNLLVNAVQAIAQDAPPGGPREVRVTTLSPDPHHVELLVEDSGPGIRDEHLPFLFNGFFTTKDGGMGIGLSICATIMDAHHGSITVVNRPGGGAAFRCRFPVSRPPA